jgi:hypothetical protein
VTIVARRLSRQEFYNHNQHAIGGRFAAQIIAFRGHRFCSLDRNFAAILVQSPHDLLGSKNDLPRMDFPI